MARKIEVEGTGEFIKRSAAELRLRCLLAEGICNSLGKLIAIRMLPIAERPAHPRFIYARRKPYIPAVLPPAELPGISFEPPALREPLFPHTVFPDHHLSHEFS